MGGGGGREVSTSRREEESGMNLCDRQKKRNIAQKA